MRMHSFSIFYDYFMQKGKLYMTRAALRETVFRVLFRYEFFDLESFKSQINLFFAEYPDDIDEEEKWPSINEEAVIEITNKVLDISCHIEEIDSEIEKNCDGWTIDRIGKAELSIMRIAIYEILYDNELETAVSISEAVKLAKKYCDEKSHSFVNGVLAKFVK